MSTGPAPTPTPDTLPYWEASREGRFVLPFCTACQRYFFYPRPFCRHCSSSDVEWRASSGKGQVASYVINHRPAPAFDVSIPQVIAIVELDEGPRMVSNIVGVAPEPGALAIGMRLEVDFDPRGEWQLPVFRPAAS